MPLRHGEVRFAMRASTVNDFTGTVAVAHAEFFGTDLANVRGIVELRVADMRTGIGLRDSHLRGAMHADSLPWIRFELVAVERSATAAGGDTVPVTFTGTLTLHGVTRPLQAPGWVVARPDGVEVEARFPVDMRDYGIRPPSRFLGAVRVNPVTDVRVNLSFGR